MTSLNNWRGRGSLPNLRDEERAQTEYSRWEINKYAENTHLHNIPRLRKERKLNEIRKNIYESGDSGGSVSNMIAEVDSDSGSSVSSMIAEPGGFDWWADSDSGSDIGSDSSVSSMKVETSASKTSPSIKRPAARLGTFHIPRWRKASDIYERGDEPHSRTMNQGRIYKTKLNDIISSRELAQQKLDEYKSSALNSLIARQQQQQEQIRRTKKEKREEDRRTKKEKREEEKEKRRTVGREKMARALKLKQEKKEQAALRKMEKEQLLKQKRVCSNKEQAENNRRQRQERQAFTKEKIDFRNSLPKGHWFKKYPDAGVKDRPTDINSQGYFFAQEPRNPNKFVFWGKKQWDENLQPANSSIPIGPNLDRVGEVCRLTAGQVGKLRALAVPFAMRGGKKKRRKTRKKKKYRKRKTKRRKNKRKTKRRKNKRRKKKRKTKKKYN